MDVGSISTGDLITVWCLSNSPRPHHSTANSACPIPLDPGSRPPQSRTPAPRGACLGPLPTFPCSIPASGSPLPALSSGKWIQPGADTLPACWGWWGWRGTGASPSCGLPGVRGISLALGGTHGRTSSARHNFPPQPGGSLCSGAVGAKEEPPGSLWVLDAGARVWAPCLRDKAPAP